MRWAVARTLTVAQYLVGKRSYEAFINTKTNIGNKVINSPVDGYIFDLKPVISGYSAQMTETIVKVVPMGDLNAYLEVPSSDIGFIKRDMDVDISIDSYPSSDFGVIKGKIDIIIGTQIISKGHNFPLLSFVGVLDTDIALKGGDIRATERTFQLLRQVVGRSGSCLLYTSPSPRDS